MSKQSAGLLVFRKGQGEVEVLLLHLAGPFWAHKDVWSIPKGELDDGEDQVTAAKREFKEELGIEAPAGEWLDLGSNKQRDKENFIWAVESNVDLGNVKLESMFTMEWPPKSGKQQEFLENDRAEWFQLADAKQKMFKAQTPFIDRLAEKLGL